MRFKNMPGWTRRMMAERKFRKAVIRAAKFDTIRIMARWDKGHSYTGWENGPETDYSWQKIPLHGMISQAYVPVYVEGRTLRHTGLDTWIDTQFQKEAGKTNFWDWEPEVD